MRGDVPPVIAELLARMLAKDPAARPDLQTIVRTLAPRHRDDPRPLE
jgi:hypothetical protein